MFRPCLCFLFGIFGSLTTTTICYFMLIGALFSVWVHKRLFFSFLSALDIGLQKQSRLMLMLRIGHMYRYEKSEPYGWG
jgi:hypothetical protein